MAYTSGTAANYKDLLAVLATFAAANGWVIKEQTTDKLFLMGTGLAGLDEIYCGVDTYEDPVNGRYNWNLVGSWGYRAGRVFSKMPHNSNASGTNLVVAYFWNAAIPYWMVANGRRIIVVAKVGTTYQMVHLGLLTPPATDAQYPYPLLVGGAGKLNTQNYSLSTLGHFWGANGASSSLLHTPGGAWSIFATATGTDSTPNHYSSSVCDTYRESILSGIDGTYMIEPVYMVASSSNPAIYGHIEGLYRVTGYQNTSENIITVDGVNYIVFQDASRSGYGDYCCMRMN